MTVETRDEQSERQHYRADVNAHYVFHGNMCVFNQEFQHCNELRSNEI